MTENQAQAICPQCGSSAAVHSVQELSALIQGRLGGLLPGFGQPAAGGPPARGWEQPPQPGRPPGPPQPGWVGQPQSGPPPAPQPGWAGEPQAGPPPGPGQVGEPQAGPPPGPPPGSGYVGEPQAGPPPGAIPSWAREPRSGRPQGPGLGSGSGPLGLDWSSLRRSGSVGDAIEDEIAGAALGAAARFIGKRIGKKVQQAYTERVQPAMAARRDAMLQEQLAIAERHPGLRACLTDEVIFLAGGSRVLPLSSVRGGLTLEQSDAIVAQLSGG